MKLSYCQHSHGRPDPQAPALEVSDCSAGYPGEERPALRRINLSVPKGQMWALVGANGAGKSTLFKAIAGQVPVVQGCVRVFGHALKESHHRVVYLPQRSEIDWHFPMTVLEFVLTGRYVYLGWLRRPGSRDVQIAQDRLRQLHAADLGCRQIHRLSGGQQQRVLIARALTQNADLMLLDEPLNAVDSLTRDVVAQVLQAQKNEEKTMIVATHFYDEEEGRYDGAIYLRDGEQVDLGHHGPGRSECC